MASEAKKVPSPLGAEFLNTNQAAAVTGRTVNALALLRARQQGPKFFKFSRSVMYKRSDLEAWLNTSR